MSFEIDIWHDDTLTMKQIENLNKLHEEYMESYKVKVKETIERLIPYPGCKMVLLELGLDDKDENKRI